MTLTSLFLSFSIYTSLKCEMLVGVCAYVRGHARVSQKTVGFPGPNNLALSSKPERSCLQTLLCMCVHTPLTCIHTPKKLEQGILTKPTAFNCCVARDHYYPHRTLPSL